MASILQTNNIFDSRFPSPHTFERPHTKRSVTTADNLQPFGWNDVNNIWSTKPQISPDEQADESQRQLASPVRNGIPTFTSQDVRPAQYPGHWKQNGQSMSLAGNHGSFASPVRSRNDSASSIPTSLSLSKSGLLSASNPDIDPLPQTIPRKQSLGLPFPNNPWQRIREFQPLSTIQNGQSSSYTTSGIGQSRPPNGTVSGQAPFVNGMMSATNGGDHEIPQFRTQRAMSSDLRPVSSSSLSYQSTSNGHVIGRDDGTSVYSADFLSPAMENLSLNYTNGQIIDDGNRHSNLMTYQVHSRHGMRPNKVLPPVSVKGGQNSPVNGFAQHAFEHQYPLGLSRNGYASLKDPGLSSANEFRSKVHTPYFSATGTPTIGSESRRSNSASGSSTRGSHPQASTLEQKLKTLEPQSDSFLLQAPSYQEYLAFNNQYEYGLATSAVRHGPFPEQFANNNHAMRPYGNELGAVNRPTDTTQIVRSPLLEDFRMNSKTQRYELKDIYNHVVEFSGDQHGSRFIQQKLETANSDEKDQIFNEIACDSLQLMTDVFGNYVIQKMFEHGNQSQKKVLANYMKGHVFTLSMQMYGCRVVQKALEHILTDQQASLIKELDGVVLKVVENQNGNHVIQKAIERVPGEHIQFIVDAHRGHVYELSKHAYGCRVIQRMLEYCQPQAKRVILDELQQNIGLLIKDSFGNYVVQHVIVNGEMRDRRPVIDMVQADLLANSKHKFASNVVEKAIDYAEEEQRQAILQQLTTGRDKYGQSHVTDLLKDQYGNYVIQKCLSHLKGAALQSLIYEVEQYLTQLRRVSSGKQVGALETSIKDARQRIEVARMGNGLHMNNSHW